MSKKKDRQQSLAKSRRRRSSGLAGCGNSSSRRGKSPSHYAIPQIEIVTPEDSLLPTNSGHPLAGLSHRQRRELRQEKMSQILAAIARRLDSDSSKSGEL